MGRQQVAAGYALIADLSEPSLTPISCAAQVICAEVKAPHDGLVGVGVGFGVGVGVGDLLGDGVCGRAGVDGVDDGDAEADGLGDALGLDECDGSAGVAVGPGLSITATCGGGAAVDGVEVADGVALVDGVALDDGVWVGLADPAAELFGTTISGVVPGFAPPMKPPFGWPDAACRGAGEIAFDPMTTTLAVAAEVTPARSAAVTTVFVEVAASADGSLNSPTSFMPVTSPWALRTNV
jgi:hypothetical protein